MSQRTRTMLTISVKIPLPAGSSIASLLSHLKGLIHSHFGYEPIVRVESKEVTYL